MIRRIYGVRLMYKIPPGELLSRLKDITSVLRSCRLKWPGHWRYSHSYWGRAHIARRHCVNRDIRACGLSGTDPQDKAAWRASTQFHSSLPLLQGPELQDNINRILYLCWHIKYFALLTKGGTPTRVFSRWWNGRFNAMFCFDKN